LNYDNDNNEKENNLYKTTSVHPPSATTDDATTTTETIIITEQQQQQDIHSFIRKTINIMNNPNNYYNRPKCKVGDCDTFVQQDGLCTLHGAKRRELLLNSSYAQDFNVQDLTAVAHLNPRPSSTLFESDRITPKPVLCDIFHAWTIFIQAADNMHLSTQPFLYDLVNVGREVLIRNDKKAETAKRKRAKEPADRKAEKEKIRNDKKAETAKRKRAKETADRKAEKEKIPDDKKAETKRKRAKENADRKVLQENNKDGITPTSTYVFDHQKPTKTPTTEVLHDVEYNKRFVRPYNCGGFVYSPSKGVSTDNLVVALIKEILLLLDQKLLTTTDVVSALFPKRTPQDGAYIQLNLKGRGADRILQNFKNIAPIICFLIKKWKDNPDTSKGDKMLIYPPQGSTDIHNDAKKTHRINLHFGDGKTLQLIKDKQLETLYDELICKPNCEYQIYGGTGNMFCSPTICFHRGMIHSSAGFTIVTNPSSNETALKRPAFLSDVFLELNALVDDLKCSSQSVEHHSRLLQDKLYKLF